MAGVSYKIDPDTGDFVRDANGRWVTTDHSDTTVQLAIGLHAGEWWGALVGSTLEALRQGVPPADPAAAVTDALLRALQPLVDRGEIEGLTVAAVQETPLVMRVQFVDLPSRRPVQQLVRPFGG